MFQILPGFRSRPYTSILVGVLLTLIVWLVLSWRQNAMWTPPKNYLNINPEPQHNPLDLDQPNNAKHVVMQKTLGHDQQGNNKDVIAEKRLLDISIDTTEYEQSLRRAADAKQRVMLSILDSHYIEFALNFHESSILGNSIKHFLFVCTDQASKEQLKQYNIDCTYVVVKLPDEGSNSTVYGSQAYATKTNIKTYIMLQGLKLGFNILLVDLDIILFKDPMSLFVNETYDIEISMDRVDCNSGFVFARGKPGAVQLYSLAWKEYLKYHKTHDQVYINMAIRALKQNKSVSVHELSPKEFPNGHYYFQSDNRVFNNDPPCKECIMVHNNYMGSSQAKIYRFKENLLWNVDSDQYYSNPRARYMTYGNVWDFGDQTWDEEMNALRNALEIAKIVQRKVILPTFRCCDCKHQKCSHPVQRCSLLHILNIRHFDTTFQGLYREHVFFQNAKVPSNVKTPVTDEILLQPPDEKLERYGNVTHVNVFKVDKLRSKKALDKFLRKFDDFSVMRFHSLYGDILSEGEVVEKGKGFKCDDLEQWEVKPFV